MSNSERHKERRRFRASQKEKENNMRRTAFRNKHIIREAPPARREIKRTGWFQRFKNWIRKTFRRKRKPPVRKPPVEKEIV